MKPSAPTKNPSAVTFRSLVRDQMTPLEPIVVETPQDRAERDRPMSVGALSKPILGLPLARWIPQDCHSFMDYGNGLVTAGAALATDDKAAQLAGLTLASLVLGISAVTDSRISVAKLVPIEVHEVCGLRVGSAAIARRSCSLLKSSPKVAAVHVVAGFASIVAPLLTDYRAYPKRKRAAS